MKPRTVKTTDINKKEQNAFHRLFIRPHRRSRVDAQSTKRVSQELRILAPAEIECQYEDRIRRVRCDYFTTLDTQEEDEQGREMKSLFGNRLFE